MKLLRLLPMAIVIVALGLGLLGDPGASATRHEDDRAAEGRDIWQRTCAVCHGREATGTSRGPDISEVGTAAIDFQVRTGRMPLDDPDDEPQRGEPVLDEEETEALIAHARTIITGPEAGPPEDVDTDITAGGRGYRELCAACHQSAGAGGALPNGVTAPPVHQASPREVREAIRTGPGSMPRFDSDTLDSRELADIAEYVKHLRQPGDRGGFDLGHLGPVSEGLVAMVLGLGAILLVTRWLGSTIAEAARPGGTETVSGSDEGDDEPR